MGENRDDPGEATLVPRSEPPEPERKIVLLLTNLMFSGGVMEFSLPPSGEATVGRATASDVSIDSASVSRRHALFSARDGVITLQDLGSTNGTRVNGELISDTPVEVKTGDALRFGDVVGELRAARLSRILVPKFVSAAEFDKRIDDEAERCVRYDRSVAVVAIEAQTTDDRILSRVKQTVMSNLRVLDAATQRAAGRFDILVVECEKEEAVAMAERMYVELSRRNAPAKLGVAAYPSDAPSPESLVISAQLAMRSVDEEGVGHAPGGARVLHLGEKEIVVADPSVARMYAMVERVAGTSMPALIQGETGSGKEIVAEALHTLGPRADKPLVKINCAALPETLLESELFGHEKGSFSGAATSKTGLFVEAHTGTLFLDEIGDLSLALQAKILRAVEDRRVRPVGATNEIEVDVRIVAATHKDLKTAVNQGLFRQDLFYRLSAVVLRIPALRERPREIPLLAERFAAEAFEQASRNPVPMAPTTLRALVDYSWPGNVRELRNVMQAAVMMCDGDSLEPVHLPPQVIASAGPTDGEGIHKTHPGILPRDRQMTLEEELRALERARIVEALDEAGGNQTKAADLLGMPRRTLVSKLAALGIQGPRKRKRTSED